uniref:Uncharacterized protein n=1 Tax=Oryza meridionalis TaxID=40149 RepID=A0A0E0EVR8_9ORYZ
MAVLVEAAVLTDARRHSRTRGGACGGGGWRGDAVRWWDEFIRHIFADRLIPDLRGIFLFRDQPIPLTPTPLRVGSPHPIVAIKRYL